jgi:hypothetical protein
MGESTTPMQARWGHLYADQCDRDHAPHTQGGFVGQAHTTFFFFSCTLFFYFFFSIFFAFSKSEHF